MAENTRKKGDGEKMVWGINIFLTQNSSGGIFGLELQQEEHPATCEKAESCQAALWTCGWPLCATWAGPGYWTWTVVSQYVWQDWQWPWRMLLGIIFLWSRLLSAPKYLSSCNLTLQHCYYDRYLLCLFSFLWSGHAVRSLALTFWIRWREAAFWPEAAKHWAGRETAHKVRNCMERIWEGKSWMLKIWGVPCCTLHTHPASSAPSVNRFYFQKDL